MNTNHDSCIMYQQNTKRGKKMDLKSFETVISVAVLIAANIGVIITMFCWIRAEANNDRRSLYQIQREDRKDLMQLQRSLELTVNAIQSEIKEFHYRMYEIKQNQK